jgi:prepilin-type N-terminal cleavage/methylation domain-containing protein
MKNFKVNRNSQAGLTLIELLIALAISAILVAGAYYGYQAVSSAKGQNDASLLTQAAQCARNQYANSPDFSGVSASILAASQCFPSGNVSGTVPSQVVKDSNGYIITATSSNLSTANDSISFTISGVPGPLCSQILPNLGPAAARLSAGPVGNGGQTTVLPYGGSYNPGQVGIACASGLNDIQFTVTK